MISEQGRGDHGNLCRGVYAAGGFATVARQKKLRGLPVLLRSWGAGHLQVVRNQRTERSLPIIYSKDA